MEIKKNINDGVVEVVIEGRIDTTTAPNLDADVKNDIPNAKKIIFNMKGVEYVSSAGLRVILAIQKAMTAQKGEFVLKSVNDEVMEVLDMTGFSTFLTIED